MMKISLACLSALWFVSCGNLSSSQASADSPDEDNFEVEIEALTKLLGNRVGAFPDINLDSLSISQDTLYVHITDDYATYANPVLYNQNFALIFQDIVHIAEAPFAGMLVKYRIAKRKPNTYFTLYAGNLESLKVSLHIFVNPPFTNLANSIVCVHKKYPGLDLINKFNTALAMKLKNDEVAYDLFLGADCFEVAAAYLVECEERIPPTYQTIVWETLEEMKQHTDPMAIDEVRDSFFKSCTLLQDMNPEKAAQNRGEMSMYTQH